MKFRIIITVLTMALTAPAWADLVQISRAYELEPSRVNVPVSPSSSMFFSECAGCAATSGQLNAQTRFSVNGKTVDFEEFCDAIRLAKRSKEKRSGIVLLRHIESNAIVSVSVSLRQLRTILEA